MTAKRLPEFDLWDFVYERISDEFERLNLYSVGDIYERAAKVKLGESEVAFSKANLEIDFDLVELGWLAFVEGRGPQFVEGIDAPQPEAIGRVEFKRGFKAYVFGTEDVEELGGPLGLREVTSNSFVVRQAMESLHRQAYGQSAQHPGMVPVITVDGFTAVRLKNGSAFAPNWQIAGWVDRRAEFVELSGDQEVVPNAPRPTSQPAPELSDSIPF